MYPFLVDEQCMDISLDDSDLEIMEKDNYIAE